MNNNLFLLFSLIVLLNACNKDETSNTPVSLECDNIKTALIASDAESLKTIFDPQLANLTLIDQDNNFCLHDNNLRAFVDLIQADCPSMSATIICCGCIQTFPATSEVSINFDSDGTMIERVLDLRTPDEGPLTISGVHN